MGEETCIKVFDIKIRNTVYKFMKYENLSPINLPSLKKNYFKGWKMGGKSLYENLCFLKFEI